MKKILLTGATGFIGGHVLNSLLHETKSEITVIIRPNTKSRLNDASEKLTVVEIDLTDIYRLKKYLSQNVFDVIIHIGAIRGGRRFSRKDYFSANVKSTEQFVLAAKENNSKLIFCSSVGVFGAIPVELPANNSTQRQDDNYYHYTKIEAEKIIQQQVLYGLNAVIIRPAISYGVGDFGFPFTLTKLVEKKMLFLPKDVVRIHLTNVDSLVDAFIKAIDKDVKSGAAFNIADTEPVEIGKLANFISNEFVGKDYSTSRLISKKYFEIGESVAKFFKNELWVARFQLISKSWYFDTEDSYKILKIKKHHTIPNFKIVTDWYKEINKKK